MYILTVILLLIIIVLIYILKKSKNKMLVMEKMKNTLFQMGDRVAKTHNIDEVYAIMLDVAVDIIPYAIKGSILILEEDGLFHIRAIYGFSEDLMDFTFKPEEVFLYSINGFKETAIVNNPTKLDDKIVSKEKNAVLKSKKALNINNTISSPIYIDNVLIGLLNVDSTEKNKHFTSDDLLIMNHIKNELQLTLKNFMVQKELSDMANFDYLTHIYNRRYFNYLFSKEIEKIRDFDTVCCLALIDIDDFKSINDKYGHVAGDNVLRTFSKIISNSVSKEDIYGRMSGDEFVILFVNINFESAKIKMEQIRNYIRYSCNENIKFGFSYGICEISMKNSLDIDEIFAEADRKMYDDKNTKCCRRV